MWFDSIIKYKELYMATDYKSGINTYYNNRGEYVTKSYKGNTPQTIEPLDWYKSPDMSTLTMEFTTEGIIYGKGTYSYDSNNKFQCDSFEHFFVAYDGE